VILDGSLAGTGGDGLIIGSGVNNVDFTTTVLTVQNFAKNGLSFAGGSTNTKITGMTLRLNGYNGIQLAGGTYTGTTIQNTAISDNGNAGIITAAAATGLTIGGATAGQGNNILGNGTNGIELAAGNYANSFVLGNRIVDNTQNGIATSGGVTGLTVGGTANYSPNAIVVNSANGVLLQAGDYAGTTFIRNSITLNGQDGIALDPQQGNSLTNLTIGGSAAGAGNAITSNLGAGIEVLAGQYGGTVITGNQIVGNATAGITLQPQAGAIAGLKIGGGASSAGNTIISNAQEGILVGAGTYPTTTISANAIALNGSHGIALAPASAGTIGGLVIGGTANRIIGNKGDGINVVAGIYTATSIQGNEISGNTGAGLRLTPSSGTIQSLTVGGSTSVTAGNTFVGTGGAIVAETGAYTGSVIQGNTIKGAETGISLAGAQKLLVGGATQDLGNMVSLCTNRGLYVTGTSTDSSATFNTFSNAVKSNVYLDAPAGFVLGGNAVGNIISVGPQGVYVTGAVSGTQVLGNTVSDVVTGIVLVNTQGGLNDKQFLVGDSTTLTGTGKGNNVTATHIGLYANGDLTNTKVSGNVFRATTAGGNGVVLVDAKKLMLGGSSANEGNTMTAGLGNGLYAKGACSYTLVYKNNMTASQYGILLDSAQNLFVGYLYDANLGNLIQYNQIGLFTIGTCTGTGVMYSAWVSNVTNVINGALIAIFP